MTSWAGNLNSVLNILSFLNITGVLQLLKSLIGYHALLLPNTLQMNENINVIVTETFRQRANKRISVRYSNCNDWKFRLVVFESLRLTLYQKGYYTGLWWSPLYTHTPHQTVKDTPLNCVVFRGVLHFFYTLNGIKNSIKPDAKKRRSTVSGKQFET